MQKGVLRFTLFKFPFTVEPWFWIIGALFGLSFSGREGGKDELIAFVCWMLIWFGSITIHELGHAFFQRKYGGFGTRIHLHGMGGYASSSGNFSRQQHLIITAAGPLVQLGAAILAWLILKELPKPIVPTSDDLKYLRGFLSIFAKVSIFWAVLNLIPVLPLDGGRLVQHSTGSEITAAKVGVVAGVIAAIGALLLTSFIMAPIFFGYLAFQNYQMTKFQHSGRGPLGF